MGDGDVSGTAKYSSLTIVLFLSSCFRMVLRYGWHLHSQCGHLLDGDWGLDGDAEEAERSSCEFEELDLNCFAACMECKFCLDWNKHLDLVLFAPEHTHLPTEPLCFTYKLFLNKTTTALKRKLRNHRDFHSSCLVSRPLVVIRQQILHWCALLVIQQIYSALIKWVLCYCISTFESGVSGSNTYTSISFYIWTSFMHMSLVWLSWTNYSDLFLVYLWTHSHSLVQNVPLTCIYMDDVFKLTAKRLCMYKFSLFALARYFFSCSKKLHQWGKMSFWGSGSYCRCTVQDLMVHGVKMR